ncbi:glycosyltransferase [Gracilibacillus phocaeensis]|uniref:glycosyltransferase n=1 Tax=Gracilibacillus phocaeensis TaxID=2042304 RepID=UPI001031562F|nr:glycosyltransferase [Gracilibacillus phocaeensis]
MNFEDFLTARVNILDSNEGELRLNKKNVVYVFKSLDVVRGGLTRAVMDRANMLVNSNIDVTILTVAFQPQFKTIVNKLYEIGSLDKKVKVMNFFHDMLEIGSSEREKVNDEIYEEDFYVFKDKRKNVTAYRYYKDGFYVKYKKYSESDKLLFIDYMSEARHRYQKDEYNEEGEVVRSRQMDQVTNTPRLDRYYNTTGHCAISVWLDANGDQKRTLFFDREHPKEYSQLEDFYKVWVEQKLSVLSSPIVMSDGRYMDSLVARVKADNIRKVAVLHNNHYKSPYDNTAEVREGWLPFLNNLDKFDRIVFLTKEQKEDIEQRFGILEKALVIPHAVPQIDKNKYENIDKNPHLAVTIARYKKQKKINEAIKAFSYVVKEIPDAQYHIYGFGDLQKDLEALIKKLKLTNNVKLLGFTSDPIKNYREAACSILTSDCEGFGLVLTESLAIGTPTISYDCKYGPKDIIRDGVDGYIVPKGNKKELAEKIISVMKDNELREKLSKNALQASERFSIDRYEKNWLDLIETI